MCYLIRKVKVPIASDELRNYLKLPVLLKEHVFIKTFGKVEPTIKTVDVVQLKALSPSKSVAIQAICTTFVWSDILSQNVHSAASQYEHLQNLTLVGSSPERNTCIDVLLGVCYIIYKLVVKLKEVVEISLLLLVLESMRQKRKTKKCVHKSKFHTRASFKYRKCNEKLF